MICAQCKVDKCAADFRPHRWYPEFKRSKCFECERAGWTERNKRYKNDPNEKKKASARHHRWYLRHKAEKNAATLAWHIANREKHNAMMRARAARLKEEKAKNGSTNGS